MITIEGKFGIKATILADSTNKAGVRLLTYEIEYPRLILAELNTHKMLSKNSFSSRAVPFNKMSQQLNGRPVRFGANQAGMQDKGEDSAEPVDVGPMFGFAHSFMVSPEEAWDIAKKSSTSFAEAFYKAGYHKQVYNRLLEPWQMMKTVISGTEWENFFWLRDHSAADPTLAELSRVMNEARNASKPELLEAGEWHTPYVDTWRDVDGVRQYGIYIEGDHEGDGGQIVLTVDDAVKVSCARCAAVSYRNLGYGLEKSLEVYYRLVGDERKHASAFEHAATPIESPTYPNKCMGSCYGFDSEYDWEPGVTHMDRKGSLWSGNLKGFIQYRKLIPGENYEGA